MASRRAGRLQNNVAYSPFGDDTISADQLRQVAKDQGTEIRFGDILIVRSGYMHEYNKKSRDEVIAYRGQEKVSFSGVEQSESMMECWPSKQSYYLHEVMLAGWYVVFPSRSLASRMLQALTDSLIMQNGACLLENCLTSKNLVLIARRRVAIAFSCPASQSMFQEALRPHRTSWLYSRLSGLRGQGKIESCCWSQKNETICVLKLIDV